MTIDKEHFHIRPSQVTRTFGPGSVYDNQKDSLMIMGLDFWTPEKFKGIRDEILLQEIKRNGFDSVERLVSTSSFKKYEDPGKVPVRSFPAWGFCPVCDKLVFGRNNKTGRGMKCNSAECSERKKTDKKDFPSTFPVRFVAACSNGHLDEFPWYRWVHQNQAERDACSEDNAQMYLVSNPKTMSLDSKRVECHGENCIALPRSMANSLSKDGLRFITFGCTKRRPWLDSDSRTCEDSSGADVQMKGIFKGATNIYFPLVRNAVTIPPFSDDLSERISDNGERINKYREKAYYHDWLVEEFELKSEQFPQGKWTLEQTLEKISTMEEFVENNQDSDIYKLEYDALNSGVDSDDKEFVTENIQDIPPEFTKFFDKVVLIKKTRVVSALTGFTRIDPFDSETTAVSHLSKERLSWLPVVENRGEGIFFSFKNKDINEWQAGSDVKERFDEIMTIQKEVKTEDGKSRHSPKYVFLHTFSHIIMKSLATIAGYSTASFAERIYCGDDMAGIFIYTSSPSSDGALGGLVEIGSGIQTENKLWGILSDAVYRSSLCSCDPLCSMQESEKTQQLIGASCHACTILPETCCENMNTLLDREMVDHTLRADIGFLTF